MVKLWEGNSRDGVVQRVLMFFVLDGVVSPSLPYTNNIPRLCDMMLWAQLVCRAIVVSYWG
eukprot:m.57279 g.57279  ORF g.57279 m.57279 type:complete len:61 (-) comp22358_c1_seq1:886-1068(-)